MRLAFKIAISYLLNRTRQTMVSILGVMLGVSFYIGVSAMMKGMHNYFIDKIINTSPHIIMKDEFREPRTQPVDIIYRDSAIELRGIKPKEELRGIRGGERIAQSLKEDMNLAAAPILQGQAFLRYGGKDVATSIIGIVPKDERKVSTLERDMIFGSFNDLLTNSNGIIIGEGLADKLKVRNGAKLSVVSPAGIIMKMKVVGVFNTGITAKDFIESYALLKKVQVLQNKEDTVNQIRFRTEDVNTAGELAREIEQRYYYRTEGWEETNANVFNIFVVQNAIMYSTVAAILIVAGFGIFNIISTVVTEKNKDIAILKSMGFGEMDIKLIFVIQGLVVGIVGTFAGWISGYMMVKGLAHVPINIEGEGFIRIKGFILYHSIYQYISGGLMAIVAASFSAYLPAKKAAELNPVEIIRGAT